MLCYGDLISVWHAEEYGNQIPPPQPTDNKHKLALLIVGRSVVHNIDMGSKSEDLFGNLVNSHFALNSSRIN